MPTSSADEHTMVFISGLHRSGTTQLAATLAADRDVSGISGTSAPHDEGQHLQDVYPTARSHGGPGRFAFDPGAHLTETSSLVTSDAAGRLFAQWSQYWDLDRRILLEKSPPNLIRMRFLQALYPQARFVIIVRHPVVTALATRKLATTSFMRRTLREAPLALTVRHWFAAHRLLFEDLPYLHRVHMLRWEDLVDDPQRHLSGIAEFIGASTYRELPDLDVSVDERYRQLWATEIADRPRRRIKAVLNELRDNDDITKRLGYSSVDLSVLGNLDFGTAQHSD